LRYVDADNIENDDIDFNGMDVQSPTGEHLGSVDGFIVDSHSGRPYYVVVDSGGWFKSKHFLMPVGHVRFDTDAEALVTGVDRNRVNRFPGFDKDRFHQMSEADLKRINDDTCAVMAVEGVAIAYAADEPIAHAWNRPDFRQPDWWTANPVHPGRMGERAVTAGAESAPRSTLTPTDDRREEIRMRDRDRDLGPDPSPHFSGRAQPGDVIGVETGGEQTHVGDTAEDENQRRRAAEEADRKSRD
jgi:hypothetical protein